MADYDKKNLIDAEKAYWVIGGNKPGVMTKTGKWAFADKKDAEAFIKEHGGKLANFDDAMKTTYEDMYNDTKMIREKRAKMKQMKQQKKRSKLISNGPAENCNLNRKNAYVLSSEKVMVVELRQA